MRRNDHLLVFELWSRELDSSGIPSCHCGGAPKFMYYRLKSLVHSAREDDVYNIFCTTCNFGFKDRFHQISTSERWAFINWEKELKEKEKRYLTHLSKSVAALNKLNGLEVEHPRSHLADHDAKTIASLNEQAEKDEAIIQQLQYRIDALTKEKKKLAKEKADRKKVVVMGMPRRIIRRRDM